MKQTTLCYISQGEQILMLHRVKKEQDLNRDKWIGIGGKLEPGESPEDCLLREVREETGLTLTRYRYRGLVTFVSGPETEYMHLYTATGFTGTLAEDCPEGDLQWISKETLLSLPMWEGDRIFWQLLEENAPFFSLKLVYQGDSLQEAVLDGRPLTLPVTGALGRPEKEPLLISACLLGAACRYDGASQGRPALLALQERYALIPLCPEQLGGLPTPRTPAERRGEQVLAKDGRDVTAAFSKGAAQALAMAQALGCRKALLKERSPSCGSHGIYDGTFTGTIVPGEGVTAALLRQAGFTIWGESQWEVLL